MPEAAMSKLPIVIALVTVAVGVLSACSGTDDNLPETDSADAGSSQIAKEEPQLLSDFLISLADLGPEWAVTARGVTQETPDKFFCGIRLDEAPASRTHASVSFQSNEGTIVAQVLESYGEGDGRKVMDEIAGVAASCDGWSDLDASGAPIRYFSSPLEFPALGEATVAYSAFSDTRLADRVTLEGVITLRDDILSLLVHATFGARNVNSEETVDLARLADGKLLDIP